MRAASAFIVLLAPCIACEERKPSPEATPTAASSPAPQVATPEPTSPPSAASSPAPQAAPPEAIAAQHVLVAWKGAKNAPASVKRSKREALARAEEVASKARDGGDFTGLVAEYTDDEATKGRQGNLGKFTRAKMLPAFADAAFALSVDQVSAPVETVHGYHVIKRNQ